MLDLVDNLLNRITMYRLVLYFLIALLLAAVAYSALGLLPFTPVNLLYLIGVLLIVCWTANKIFISAFQVPANSESVYITALILGLIIKPPTDAAVVSILPFLAWVSVLAMASKYILAIRGKHIFNPAAIALVITAFTLNLSANWWVATLCMLPLVLAGGLLVVRKLKRWDLFFSFLAAAVATLVVFTWSHLNAATIWQRLFVDSPLLFFGFIMLTEPFTTPPARIWRIIYGALVGLMFIPNIHVGPIYSTPELALVIGNVLAYLASPKGKYLLKLAEKKSIGADIYEFIFQSPRSLKFQPGQYLEWTLGHTNVDTRGNRRYFTIASSPTEHLIHLGVKFYQNSSTFKKAMLRLRPGDLVLAGQLDGEFLLPKDRGQKLAFLAGGIGITPYRSMVKYLLDQNQQMDIVLFYSNNSPREIVYNELWETAQSRLGLKIVYTLTDSGAVPANWSGEQGLISPEMVAAQMPDYRERMFYLSGPRSFVSAMEKTLRRMNIHRTRIKTDFFPGFV